MKYAAVVSRLLRAKASKNPDELEEGIRAAFELGLFPELGPILADLLGEPWHARHEDLVSALQVLREKRAVEVLEVTATREFGYLEYDERYGLARKCTWALADIGSADAFDALSRLAKSDNSLIAAYAQKRIDRWQSELHRKGA